MFCINCFNKSTSVVNSRPNKKQPAIWRRRKCPECGTVFTTYERPSLAENKPIHIEDGKTVAFNLGKLILSIAKSFAHAPEKASYEALWLAQSVEDILSTQYKVIACEDVEAVTHTVLERYDELAAMQYAMQHRLITSKKRRR